MTASQWRFTFLVDINYNMYNIQESLLACWKYIKLCFSSETRKFLEGNKLFFLITRRPNSILHYEIVAFFIEQLSLQELPESPYSRIQEGHFTPTC